MPDRRRRRRCSRRPPWPSSSPTSRRMSPAGPEPQPPAPVRWGVGRARADRGAVRRGGGRLGAALHAGPGARERSRAVPGARRLLSPQGRGSDGLPTEALVPAAAAPAIAASSAHTSPGVHPLLAGLLEVDAEPEVVVDLNEQVGEPDRAVAGGVRLSQTNLVTPASALSSSRCSRSRRSLGGTRSAMRASIRRSASTSASAQSRSIVVMAGRMVRLRRQASTERAG